jgi:hypothetical protein
MEHPKSKAIISLKKDKIPIIYLRRKSYPPFKNLMCKYGSKFYIFISKIDYDFWYLSFGNEFQFKN